MDITPLIKAGHNIIQGYGEGFLRINGKIYEESVFVMPEHIMRWSYEGAASGLGIDDFAAMEPYWKDIDIFLIGCGNSMTRIDRSLQEALRAHNVSVDVMDTPAACRTYNVLVPEGRLVAAALLAP